MIFELFDYLLELLYIVMFEYYDKKSIIFVFDEEVYIFWF